MEYWDVHQPTTIWGGHQGGNLPITVAKILPNKSQERG
jgi:hypothetical protein